MKENKLKDVYVSWNIPFEKDLIALQNNICSKYDLLPRKELHVTLGFIGEAYNNQLDDLSQKLKADFSKEFINYFNVAGIGGATVNNGQTILLDKNINIKNQPRVFWLYLKPLEKLKTLRLQLSKAVKEVGLNNSKITETFIPHITLGSNGPNGDDWSLWDVHNTDKSRIFIEHHLNICSNKFHITNVSVHPDSLNIIIEWPVDENHFLSS